MRRFYHITLILMAGLFNLSCAAKAPVGKLIYCSYAETGAAGLGKDYCELVADEGSTPKVVVALHLRNRFGEPEIHKEYPVDAEVVQRLQDELAQMAVYKLNGYNLEEPITGGYARRIYLEYDSGEKININWYGSGVKDKVQAAYNYLVKFFEPWRNQAQAEEPAE